MKKMYDVAYKSEEGNIAPMKKNEKYYPSLHFNEKTLPCLKGAKVGDKISLLASCEITGTNKHNDNPTEYTLEVHKLGEENEMRMAKAMAEAVKEKEE